MISLPCATGKFNWYLVRLRCSHWSYTLTNQHEETSLAKNKICKQSLYMNWWLYALPWAWYDSLRLWIYFVWRGRSQIQFEFWLTQWWLVGANELKKDREITKKKAMDPQTTYPLRLHICRKYRYLDHGCVNKSRRRVMVMKHTPHPIHFTPHFNKYIKVHGLPTLS